MTNKYMLVYQNGIANVFAVDKVSTEPDGRNASRVYQGDVITAHGFCLGLLQAEQIVSLAVCNQVGDTANSTWTEDFYKESLYIESFASCINGLAELFHRLSENADLK